MSSTDKNESKCDTLLNGPCNCSKQACIIGCEGCDQWGNHSGTDCKEMFFCCLPFSFVLDTLVFPFTVTKCMIRKCCTESPK
jgi:hypothetical protein